MESKWTNFICSRERVRLNKSKGLIFNQENRSQWYNIISEQVTRGTGWEGINWDCLCQTGKVSTTVLVNWPIKPSTLKTKAIISNCITISEVWFPWFSLIGQDCRVFLWFSVTWFRRYCPYWMKYVRGLAMNFCTSVWIIDIVCQSNMIDKEDCFPAEMVVAYRWGR